MKLFEFDEHIGDWRVLVQSKDIKNGAIQGRHIASDAISGNKIAPNTIPGRCFQDESITGDKIENDTVIPGKLAKDSITTRVIKNGAVTPEKLSRRVLTEVINPITDDLQNQITSQQIHGLAVSNELGNEESDKMIGVSKWYLTNLFNRIWDKFSEITGEVLNGITMSVTPTYFTGDKCTVHIVARTVDTDGIFERMYFYWDNSEIPFAGSDVPVSLFEADAELRNTAVIKCRAKIMGIWYEKQELIVRNDFFWLGAGATYQSIFNDNHKHNADSCCMRGNYDIACGNGNHIYFIIPDAASSAFQRADMNGIEIAFTQSTFTDEYGNVFRVYTSENIYQAGTYNIDVNG